MFDLYPAVDLRGGRTVRLHQGDYGRETSYAAPPVEVAERFASTAGVRWLHVVDLDAALTGEPVNRPVVAEMAATARAHGVAVQVGGGVRDRAAAEALFEAGAARVVVGTAAVERPDFVRDLARDHPGQVAVGLDARAGQVAVRGWTEGGGRSVADLLAVFEDAGVAAVVFTEIARDGTLAGPDLVQFAAVVASTAVPVIASGGVGGVADIEALARLEAGGRRLAGVIVGKALHDGLFTVGQGVAACAV